MSKRWFCKKCIILFKRIKRIRHCKRRKEENITYKQINSIKLCRSKIKWKSQNNMRPLLELTIIKESFKKYFKKVVHLRHINQFRMWNVIKTITLIFSKNWHWWSFSFEPIINSFKTIKFRTLQRILSM